MTQKKEWITVGALGDGFAIDSFILPYNNHLDGKTFTLNTACGQHITCQFEQQQITWLSSNEQKIQSSYRVSSLRESFYFIDFIDNQTSYSTVLDLKHHSFTTIVGRLPCEQDCNESLYQRTLTHQELTLVNIELLQGSVNQPYDNQTICHKETDELIGVRNLYHYSPTESYEHIYLNQNFYTWHCTKGVEAGLTDTDRCHYYKLDTDLYFFIWREKIIPTLGIVIIDMQHHRSDGKICGYATGELTNLTNFPVSSYCKLINKTTY